MLNAVLTAVWLLIFVAQVGLLVAFVRKRAQDHRSSQRAMRWNETKYRIQDLERELRIGLAPGECNDCRTFHPPGQRCALLPPRLDMQNR